ncbi:hypothetical protein N431DRAFT_466106 [Stipitochalara longipes BDJ]|nr:hypothetical protein N431DRAFT_466106 [Stipitochalara longipes BDJ]
MLSLTLNLVEWYAVGVGCLSISLILYFLSNYFKLPTRIRFVASTVSYRLVLARRYWSSITLLEALIFSIYLIVNSVLMSWGVLHSLAAFTSRARALALINMIPLFLGGRTNFLADSLGIPLHTYYLAHHWIGRVVVLQSLLHLIPSLISRTTRTVAAILLASALTSITLTSLFFIRRRYFEIFWLSHVFLALLSVASSIWLLLPVPFTQGLLFPIIALSFWGFNLLAWLIQIIHYNIRNKEWGQRAEVSQLLGGAIKVELELKRPVNIRPGQYGYIYCSELRRFQTHPFMITWWDPLSQAHPSASIISEAACPKAAKLHFLIEPQDGVTSRLAKCNEVNVYFSGPYGQNLHLDDYENVILVAQGIGIAGILPHALHLIRRYFHIDAAYRRGLATRRIDIFWLLEENSQESWAAEYLSLLQSMDPKNFLLQIWCYYPHKMASAPPILLNEHYECIYGEAMVYTIPTAIKLMIDKLTGRSNVVACGAPKFTEKIRKSVLGATSVNNVLEFTEVEYRPWSKQHLNFDSIYLQEQDNSLIREIQRRKLLQPRPANLEDNSVTLNSSRIEKYEY